MFRCGALALMLLCLSASEPLAGGKAITGDRTPPAKAPKAPSSPADGENADAGPPGEIGPAPDFSLSDLKGLIVDSAYTSRPVTVVHFWATWCVPCMREIPELNRLAEHYVPAGAAIYAVAIDSGSVSDLRQVERSFHIRHRVLLGDEHIARAFGGVASFPTTFLVDERGRIVERHNGSSKRIQQNIEKSIRGLLAASGRPLPHEP